MSETLLSILCGQDGWHWLDNTNTITFNKNGTGELVCRYELIVWIAAEFEWKPQSPESLDQVVDVSGIGPTRKDPPQPISQFDIELTLAKRRIPSMRGPDAQRRRMNESLLTDDAFLPKTYTVRLERGNFLTPYDAMLPPEKEDQYHPRFALRLVFDKSPYPPQHEWKEPGMGPDATKMWEWKEFVGRESADLKMRADRHAWWKDCVVS
ncbi:MAG: hypothetical protein M1826_002796 [Phylliscum demangeonii]|nr:MAG: hypothetical protein M1826_002796 [Phylliscum demangeonii]